MATRPLPSELVALVHHVELSSQGWKKKLMEQLAAAALLSQGEALDVGGTQSILKSLMGMTIAESDLRRALETLCSKNEAVQPQPGQYRLTEERRSSLQLQVSETSAIATRVEGRYVSIVTRHGLLPEGPLSWSSFCQSFLTPFVGELGARTYSLLTGQAIPLSDTISFAAFTANLHASAQESFYKVVSEFFDANDQATRQFVLQHLQAHFLTRAASLTDATVSAIADRLKGQIKLSVFVDTNVLFSILDLHENPANEAARDMLHVLKGVSQKVRASLYVLPPTLDEAKRTLLGYQEQLSAIVVSAQLGRAASRMSVGLSGIAQRFFVAAGKSGTKLGAREYFEPYVTDLLSVCRGKGVELYNADLEAIGTDQPVVDDILEQQEREKQRRVSRPKTYESWKHDVSLWHFAQRQRPRHAMSLDAIYWVVTVDNRLLSFDAHKQKNDAVPVCIHPTSLVQMLQFWTPTNPEIEKALVNSIRSVIPHKFDVEAEKASIAILNTLARYENVDDLSEETVASFLTNKALRSKVSAGVSEDAVDAMVKEALLDEVASSKALAAQATKTADELAARLKQAEHDRESIESGWRNEQKTKDQAERELELLKSDSLERQRAFDVEKEALAIKLVEQESSAKITREAQQLSLDWMRWFLKVGVLTAIGILAIALWWNVSARFGWKAYPDGARFVLLVVAICSLVAVRMGDSEPLVSRTTRFRRLRKQVIAALTGAMILILGQLLLYVFGLG